MYDLLACIKVACVLASAENRFCSQDNYKKKPLNSWFCAASMKNPYSAGLLFGPQSPEVLNFDFRSSIRCKRYLCCYFKCSECRQQVFLQAVSKDGLNKTWTCEESLMLSDMLSVMIISIDENLRHNSKGVISGNGEDENRLGHYGKKQSGQSDKGVEPNSKGSPQEDVNRVTLSGCA